MNGSPHSVSPKEAAAQSMAAACIDAARQHLDTIATATDDPRPGMVEAADLLDAAREALQGNVP